MSRMKKKKILATILILLLIAATAVVIIVNRAHSDTSDKIQTYDTVEEAIEAADFDFQYTDRLCGYPATGYQAVGNTIEITYGDAGFVRKTYLAFSRTSLSANSRISSSVQLMY